MHRTRAFALHRFKSAHGVGGSVANIPLGILGLFFASVGFQLLAVMLLPRTQGFTNPLPTVGCAALFVCGIWMVARLYHGGAKLGIVMPLLAAVIPIGIIAIGVLMYGERASFFKILVLLAACGLVGAAAKMT
jgi:quaternary ammonium compound-resistance protein SugE